MANRRIQEMLIRQVYITDQTRAFIPRDYTDGYLVGKSYSLESGAELSEVSPSLASIVDADFLLIDIHDTPPIPAESALGKRLAELRKEQCLPAERQDTAGFFLK